MKTLLSIVIAFVIFSGTVYSQFIISGQTGAGDIFTDIEPNSILEGQMIPQNNGDEIIIDINQDGTSDIKIKTDAFGANGGGYSRCFVYALSDNVKIVSHKDTLYPPNNPPLIFTVADTLNIGDTISADFIGYSSAYLWSTFYGPIYDIPYTHEWWDIGERYIGVRISDTNGVLYGWIRASATYCTTVLYDYACNQDPFVGIGNKNKIINIEIYPNPTNDYLNIELPSKINIAFVEIYNSQEKLVKSQRIFDKHNKVDVRDLPNGVYIVQFFGEWGSVAKKLIKY